MIQAYKSRVLHMALGVSAVVFCGATQADTAVIDDTDSGFSQQTGQELYESICLGCHMANGQGAKGAGDYPALAENPRLTAAGYPLYVVTYGQRAMPAFGGRLTDKQVADVVNYVRTHFGNNFEGNSTAADVAKIRIPDYDYVTLE